jgi:osmotically inducible protein OsmC
MGSVRRTAEIEWEGTISRGAGRVSARSGAFTGLPVTLASRIGDPEGKTSPEELIAAAHASCFTTTLGVVLARAGTPPERLHVAATVILDTDEGGTITTSELDVRGVVPGADQAAFEQAAAVAKERCPVSRALQGNVEFRVNATLEDGAAEKE